MDKFKYTTDGKKVIVVGDLNQTDKIVQEIFITESGDEIPQGERFVVKNLMDEPAVSWQEKRLADLEIKYIKDVSEWRGKIESLQREKQMAYDSLSAKVKWLRGVAKEPRDESFKKVINLLADFLSDTTKWIAVTIYSEWHVVEFNDESVSDLLNRYEGLRYGSEKRFDSMRLLSLYGKTGGDLTFKINEYSDGSGSDREVSFFKTKEEALSFVQRNIEDKKQYTEYDIKNAEKFNLTLNHEKLRVYREKKNESIKNRIDELNEQVEKLRNTML